MDSRWTPRDSSCLRCGDCVKMTSQSVQKFVLHDLKLSRSHASHVNGLLICIDKPVKLAMYTTLYLIQQKSIPIHSQLHVQTHLYLHLHERIHYNHEKSSEMEAHTVHTNIKFKHTAGDLITTYLFELRGTGWQTCQYIPSPFRPDHPLGRWSSLLPTERQNDNITLQTNCTRYGYAY